MRFLRLGVDLAERGRRQHAERSREHGGDVGEHVAEQVVGDDDVELLGPAHELHAAGIRQLVLEHNVLELARMHLVDDLVPEHAGLHHVALLHRGDLVAALARELERDAGDALDLVGVVDLGIDGALLAVAEVGDGLGLAEIDPAGQFAQDDDVESVHHLALEARGIRERGIADRGANIGEQAELLAQPQQSRLRPHLIWHAVPFRPAHRAEDHGVGRVRLGHGLIGDRDLVGVIAGAPDQSFLGVEPRRAARVHPGDELFHLGHHLGADTVPGEEKELVSRHVLPLRSRGNVDC